MSTKHKKRRLRRFIIAGVFAAALTAWAVPAAGAHTAGVSYAAVAPAVTGDHPTVSHAFLNHAGRGDLGGFLTDRHNRSAQAVVRSATDSTGNGFAWADAGIGAGAVAIALGLLGGALQVTRTRRTIATS